MIERNNLSQSVIPPIQREGSSGQEGFDKYFSHTGFVKISLGVKLEPLNVFHPAVEGEEEIQS